MGPIHLLDHRLVTSIPLRSGSSLLVFSHPPLLRLGPYIQPDLLVHKPIEDHIQIIRRHVQPAPRALQHQQVVDLLEQHAFVGAPAFVLQLADLVEGDAEHGQAERALRVVHGVVEAEDHLEHFVFVAHLLALHDGGQGGQAALAEEHSAEAEIAFAGEGAGEEHVELHDEEGGQIEVLLGPEGRVVHELAALPVRGDVDGEPHLLDRQRRRGRQHEAFLLQARDDVFHHAFAEDDHLQPAEAGHETHFEVSLGLVAALGRVADAEGAIAAEGEDAGGFGREDAGVVEDHGGEVGVGQGVEVFTDGVKGDEVGDGEVANRFKDEFGVLEETVEDAAWIE